MCYLNYTYVAHSTKMKMIGINLLGSILRLPHRVLSAASVERSYNLQTNFLICRRDEKVCGGYPRSVGGKISPKQCMLPGRGFVRPTHQVTIAFTNFCRSKQASVNI